MASLKAHLAVYWIRDVANAMRFAIEKDLDNGFEAFNIVTDKRYSEDTADFGQDPLADHCRHVQGSAWDQRIAAYPSDKKLRDMRDTMSNTLGGRRRNIRDQRPKLNRNDK